jgi:LuxR family transcriptional activator of conjugal transfer of Ti plasmids
MNRLFEQLIDISVTSCEEAMIPGRLKRWIDTSDYDGLTLLRAQGSATTYFASHAREWQTVYLDRCYFKIDPTAAIARRRRGLTPWVMRSLSNGNCARTRAMCAEASQHGIRSGFSLPISIGFGHFAIFSLYSGSSDEPDVEDRPTLAGIGHYAFA